MSPSVSGPERSSVKLSFAQPALSIRFGTKSYEFERMETSQSSSLRGRPLSVLRVICGTESWKQGPNGPLP
jgi:hypothetical protein